MYSIHLHTGASYSQIGNSMNSKLCINDSLRIRFGSHFDWTALVLIEHVKMIVKCHFIAMTFLSNLEYETHESDLSTVFEDRSIFRIAEKMHLSIFWKYCDEIYLKISWQSKRYRMSSSRWLSVVNKQLLFYFIFLNQLTEYNKIKLIDWLKNPIHICSKSFISKTVI